MNLLTRTFSIRLCGHDAEFSAALALYARALNLVSAYAFSNQAWSAGALHRPLYARVRAELGLKAQMTCSAFRQVAAAYAADDPRARAKRRSRLSVFRPTSMLLQVKRDWAFSVRDPGHIAVGALSGRVKVPFKANRHTHQYLDGTWTFGAAHLVHRRGKFYLNISCSKEVADPAPATNIVGVDLGMNYLAVASNLEHKTVFFGGGKVKDRQRHYQRVRKSLQKKGTRGAKRLLRHLSGKQLRFQRDVNHCVSKKVVQFAAESGKSLLALEDLTNIRARVKHRKARRSEFHGWGFYQLRAFIAYKAGARPLAVVLVDPRNTSRGCSRCGNTADGQRQGRSFKCLACGFELHADLNASRNIAHRARAARQDLVAPGLPSIAPEVTPVEGEPRPGTLPRVVASRPL